FTDHFLVEKSQEDELEKTNTESEVHSMVTVPIHHDTSSVPLMTTPVIDLTVSQPVPTVCIGELEQHMADMVEANQSLEERLDKHGSKAAIQAPLRDRFRELLEADIKEIFHYRMWESNSYQAHEDYKMLTKTPLGSPPHQPPPPPPPTGSFGTPGESGASRSSQLPPPPPPPSNNQSDQSTRTAASSSSKTIITAEY
ncbi:hypothetical protein Tco_1557975, partial [Tanacetum coccineum]